MLLSAGVSGFRELIGVIRVSRSDLRGLVKVNFAPAPAIERVAGGGGVGSEIARDQLRWATEADFDALADVMFAAGREGESP